VPRPVNIDLDAETVRIGQVQRLTHRMIRHADQKPLIKRVRGEAPECRSIRKQDCEMEQPVSSGAWRRRDATLLVQLRNQPAGARDSHLGAALDALEHRQPKYVSVVLDGALEIADLKTDRSDVRTIG
jgi:hypothetical protein